MYLSWNWRRRNCRNRLKEPFKIITVNVYFMFRLWKFWVPFFNTHTHTKKKNFFIFFNIHKAFWAENKCHLGCYETCRIIKINLEISTEFFFSFIRCALIIFYCPRHSALLIVPVKNFHPIFSLCILSIEKFPLRLGGMESRCHRQY